MCLFKRNKKNEAKETTVDKQQQLIDYVESARDLKFDVDYEIKGLNNDIHQTLKLLDGDQSPETIEDVTNELIELVAELSLYEQTSHEVSTLIRRSERALRRSNSKASFEEIQDLLRNLGALIGNRDAARSQEKMKYFIDQMRQKLYSNNVSNAFIEERVKKLVDQKLGKTNNVTTDNTSTQTKTVDTNSKLEEINNVLKKLDENNNKSN